MCAFPLGYERLGDSRDKLPRLPHTILDVLTRSGSGDLIHLFQRRLPAGLLAGSVAREPPAADSPQAWNTVRDTR